MLLVVPDPFQKLLFWTPTENRQRPLRLGPLGGKIGMRGAGEKNNFLLSVFKLPLLQKLISLAFGHAEWAPCPL